MDYKVIAIDGPAGAGKSTIARRIAELIGYTYIDSGAMYRALTLKALRENIAMTDVDSIIRLAEDTDIDFKENSIYLDGKACDKEIREESVNKNVSFIAAIPEVRSIMVDLQRKISLDKNVVMDGRDVGTVIFPDAGMKFFITASVEERALRRYNELKQKGYEAEIEDIKAQLKKRDHIDSTRDASPLKAAPDAVLIDTTGKNVNEVLDEVKYYIDVKGGGIDVI